MNVFTRSPEQYVRNLNFVDETKRDYAFFLQRETGYDFDYCLNFVNQEWSETGSFPMENPSALVLAKNTPGNRVKEIIPLQQYFQDVIDNKYIISPTLVTYKNTEQEESLISEYTDNNVKLRSKDKKEKFQAEMRGNKELANIKEDMQSLRKIKNNGMSGAFSSPSTPLLNMSAHSSLTSGCRAGTSLGNANNEKLIAGNRHLWCFEVALSNIVTICRHTDLIVLEEAIKTYGLVYPTPEQVLTCIKRSTDPYWRCKADFDKIESLVRKLPPIELAAVMYVGDLHHLAMLNRDVVYGLIDGLSSKGTILVDNPDEVLDKVDDDLKILISLVCGEQLKGMDIPYAKEHAPDVYRLLASTLLTVKETLHKYALLIKAILVTDNMPQSIAVFPSIIRRVVVTSDTDSTIFTVESWVQWFTGSNLSSEKADAVAAAVVYVSSQSVIHLLAMMSANLGIETKYIHKLQMKNEFMFPVFIPCSRAKHYWAYQSAKEGNVYKKFKFEVKGVEMRDSNIPAFVTEMIHDTCKWIMDEIIAKGTVSVHPILETVYKIEMDIYRSLENRTIPFLRRGKVNPPESYKKGEDSTYQHYVLWRDVFAKKYGECQYPAYRSVVVSVDLKSKTKVKTWLENMKDQSIANGLRAWLLANNRDDLTSIHLPEEVVANCGIPEEICDVIDKRKTVFATTRAFYLMLESLGFFMKDKNLTKLVSDFYIPIPKLESPVIETKAA